MARKIPVKLVMKYRNQGLSRNMIAKTQKVGKTSVSEVFKRAEELQLTYEDIESLQILKRTGASFQSVINLKFFTILLTTNQFIKNFRELG